jgi:prolyl-tRNA synthetase
MRHLALSRHNFAKAFEIRFPRYAKPAAVSAWQTSWGVSTRLLGAIVMSHGDDQGLRLPPKPSPLFRP